MNTTVKNAVMATERTAQYDEKAKSILSQKDILAWILASTVDVFQGMDPKDIVPLIEGEPKVGVVPVEPGMTNTARQEQGRRIVGLNSENAENEEGMIRFDIIFYVHMPPAAGMPPGDDLAKIIVNIEAQKEVPTEYPILNRAIFYEGRLISSQKERDFVKMDYDQMKRTFSIWICMNMEEDKLGYVHLIKEALLGTFTWEGDLDLINIIMIGLAKEKPKLEKDSEQHELHRLLRTLFTDALTADEKLNIIEQEYQIPLEDGVRTEVQHMCNLGEGIMEEGWRKGMLEGRAEGHEEGHAEGREEGRIEGLAEGRAEERQSAIRALMESMHWTKEQAMAALQYK